MFLFLAALLWGLAGTPPARGAGPVAGPAGPLAGRWRTFANGDDILVLARGEGRLWAGTRAGGLVRWDLAGGRYQHFLRPQDPLTGNTVNDLALDAAGRLWLATDGGLTMLDDRGTANAADDLWRGYTRAGTGGGLPSDDVRAVAVRGNQVWVGTAQVKDLATGEWSGGGLAMLDTGGTERSDDDRWAPVASYASTIRRNLDGTTQLGLVSDNVQDILLSPAGNLWVATAPHWILDQPPDPDKPRRWISVHGGLSYRDTRGSADPADDRWTPTSCESMQFTVTCNVRALALDAFGNAWAAIGGRGVMVFRADDPVIIDERSRRFDSADGLADNFVEAIAFGPAEDPALAHTVWLGTRDGGLAVLDHAGTLRDRSDDTWNLGRARPFSEAEGLTRSRVQALAMAAGELWLGTGPRDGVGGGLQRLDLASQAIGPARLTDRGLPGNFVTDLDFGRPGTRWAGHVWIGTGSRSPAARRFGQGLVDLDTAGTRDPADDSWRRYTAKLTDDDGRAPWSGLPGDNIHAVLVQRDRVWAGAAETVWDGAAGRYADGGLALFDGSRWTARRVDNTGSPAGLRDGSVSALAPGCAGEVWVATGNAADNSGGGVAALTAGGDGHDRATDRWQTFAYPELPSNNVLDIASDCAAGKVWVAAAHHDAGGRWEGGGAGVRDLAAGTWKKYDTTSGLESYADASIKIKAEARSVLAGPNGSAWVGTYGTRNTKTTELVLSRPYWPAVLNSWQGAWRAEVFLGAGWVSSLARDLEGRLWLATSRGGAARDDAQPESWRVDTVPVPKATATPSASPARSPTPTRTGTPPTPRPLPGAGGGLWVLDGGQWLRIDVPGGLPANDISVVAVGPDGDVWVGTEGWGIGRLELGVDPATATPTNDAPTPTSTLTPSPAPSATTRPTDPGGTATRTATRAPASPTTVTPPGPRPVTIFLPKTLKWR